MDKHQIDDGVSVDNLLDKDIGRLLHNDQELCEELLELEIAENISLGLRLRRKHNLEFWGKHHPPEVNDEPSVVAV